MFRLVLTVLFVFAPCCSMFAVEYVAPENLPLMNKKVIRVRTVSELENVLSNVADYTTVVLAPGTYKLSSLIYISGKNNIEIRGQEFNRNLVKIMGKGYENKNYGEARHCIEFNACTNVRVANLSIGDVWFHPIAIQGNCTDAHFYNMRFFDAGEQFLKGTSNGESGRGVLRGRVEYCLFEYTKMARSWYTNGIDIHTGKDWIIKNNIFYNIVGPANDKLAGHAILMWNGAENTLCEDNLILNCARGIAYGLSNSKPKAKGRLYDHKGGEIRKNVFIRGPGIRGDDGIIVNNSPGTKVIQNVVLCNGYATPIEYRFKDARDIVISQNILDGRVEKRNGASGLERDNKTVSKKDTFCISLRKSAAQALEDAQKFTPKFSSFVYLKKTAQKMFAKKLYGRYLKTVRSKLNSEIEAEKAEAEELFAFVDRHFHDSMTTAGDLFVTDPIASLEHYKRISKQFAGDALAAGAEEKVSEIKSMDDYKAEKSAASACARLQAMEKSLKPYKGAIDFKNLKFQKLNSAQLKSMIRGIDALLKKHPQSRYKQVVMDLRARITGA